MSRNPEAAASLTLLKIGVGVTAFGATLCALWLGSLPGAAGAAALGVAGYFGVEVVEGRVRGTSGRYGE